jgi:DNA-binding beta-propeller fold protein YncE
MGSDGMVYVTDGFNHRVQVFRHDNGAFVRTFGTEGDGVGQLGQLHLPQGVCCSQGGVLYVADYWNNRIQAFSLLQQQQQL